MNKKTITITWVEKTVVDTERVGAMFCFKSCNVNQN